MSLRKVKVTCLKCGNSDVIGIDDTNHLIDEYTDGVNKYIVAARWRPDLSWGWECICGNYDLLADEEKKDFTKYVNASPNRLDEISTILADKKAKLFNVEDI